LNCRTWRAFEQDASSRLWLHVGLRVAFLPDDEGHDLAWQTALLGQKPPLKLKEIVYDVVQGSHVAARAIVMQRKTRRPVQFEITEQTRDAVKADSLRRSDLIHCVIRLFQSWLMRMFPLMCASRLAATMTRRFTNGTCISICTLKSVRLKNCDR
jgi:hypothetical protein